jgi:hypothetical protein|tara:strand:+ start:3707 stop:4375 length:669 start_codon:yes stop_codon:yes gene_type:complete
MKQNFWINPKTSDVVAHNTKIGSPRTWLQKAIHSRQCDGGTEMYTRELNVGAVWPTESKPSLKLPPADIIKLFTQESKKMIGFAWKVPNDKVDDVIQSLNELEPVAMWYTEVVAARVATQSFADAVINGRLSHAVLYAYFDKGISANEVAFSLNRLPNTIQYVYTKWKDGRPAFNKRGRKEVLNDTDILTDIRSGMSAHAVSLKYECTVVTVNKIVRKHIGS